MSLMTTQSALSHIIDPQIRMLNKKGKKIMKAMKKTYGKKAEQVFYATKNKGKLKGTERKRKKI